MRKIFVHAGFHKTGTTSVQEFCTRNRTELRRHGLHYARLDYRRMPDHPNHSYVLRAAYDAAISNWFAAALDEKTPAYRTVGGKLTRDPISRARCSSTSRSGRASTSTNCRRTC